MLKTLQKEYIMLKKIKAKFILSVVLFSASIFTGIVYASPLGFVETIRENDPGTGGGDNPNRNLYFPSGISTSSDGENVYVTSLLDNALTAFSRDQVTGQLTEIDAELQSAGVDGLDGVTDVIVSPDGKHVYTIGDGDNGSGSIIETTILGFSRNTDGTLIQSSKIQDRDLAPNFEHIVGTRLAFSPDSNFLYIISSNDRTLWVFQRSSETGVLTFVQSTNTSEFPVNITDALDHARGLTVSPDGNNLYVVGTNSSAVSGGDVVVMSRDTATGEVTGMEIHEDLLNNIVDMKAPDDVVISPDGKHMYVAANGSETSSDDSVVIFTRATDGSLTYQSTVHYLDGTNDVLFSPSRISINPEGNLLYVGSDIVETVSIFKRDSDTGSITPIGFEKDDLRDLVMGSVIDMDITADGKFLYVATDQKVDGITVFDLTTDLLLEKTADKSTVGTGQTLSYNIAVSNNGASDATEVEIIDTLPTDVTFISASVTAAGGSCLLDNNTVTCLIDRVATGAGEIVTIDVTTPASEMTLTNEASVSAVQIDEDALNDVASVSTIVSNSAEPEPDTNSDSGSLGLLSLLVFSLAGFSRLRRMGKLY